MLDSLRKFASSLLGKVLTVLLLIGLAGFGISNILTTIGSDVVARVGGQDITTRQFQRAYNTQINQVAQQLGTTPTPQQAVAFGVPGSTLNRLASDAALNELASRLGLGASDAKLGELLRQDPSFQGTLGKFDANRFQQILQQNGFTETEYFNDLRDSAGRQQIVLSTLADLPAPKTAVALVNRYYDDKRTLDYFVITPQSILPPADPTEEEMAAYLKDNQAQFRTQPTRTAKVMVLSPQALSASVSVTEDEIAARYEQTKSGLTQVETRHIEQVVLPDAQKLDAFKSGLGAGKSYADLVKELNLTPIDLGTLSKAQVTDSELADAAFSISQGETKLIPGVVGTRAVTVLKINPGHQKSLAEAHDQVEKDLRLKKARDEYTNILDQIEEMRAALKPIADIAKQFGLPEKAVTLTSNGNALADVAEIPANDRTRVATAIFNQEQGALAPGIALSSNLNVWFDLEKVTPARDQTLDEVKDAVKNAMLAARTDKAMQTEAEDAAKAIKSGTSIDAAAIARNVTPNQSQPMTRQGDGKTFTQTVATAAFDGPVGHVGFAKNTAGDYVVFKVADVTPADTKAPEQIQKTVDGAVRDDIYSEFVSALRADAGMNVNQQVLTQVIGLN